MNQLIFQKIIYLIIIKFYIVKIKIIINGILFYKFNLYNNFII